MACGFQCLAEQVQGFQSFVIGFPQHVALRPPDTPGLVGGGVGQSAAQLKPCNEAAGAQGFTMTFTQPLGLLMLGLFRLAEGRCGVVDTENSGHRVTVGKREPGADAEPTRFGLHREGT